MLQAFSFGLIAGSALLLGAIFGISLHPSKKITATIMAFGSGVLISALTFDLIDEAYKMGGIIPVSLGFVAGALFFVLIDWLIGLWGGHHRKHLKGKRTKHTGEVNSWAITAGALLDGVPESIMIGVGLLTGSSTGILMFIAVFLSNFPEGISGVYGLTNAKKSNIFIIFVWSFIALACGASALFGYTYLVGAEPAILAIVSAAAAGSILAMITDTMIPEAFEEGGIFVGLATVFGFLLAFIISRGLQ